MQRSPKGCGAMASQISGHGARTASQRGSHPRQGVPPMSQSWGPHSVTIPSLSVFPVPVGNWWFEEVWHYCGIGAVVSLCLIMGDDDDGDDDKVMSPSTCGYASTGHLHALAWWELCCCGSRATIQSLYIYNLKFFSCKVFQQEKLNKTRNLIFSFFVQNPLYFTWVLQGSPCTKQIAAGTVSFGFSLCLLDFFHLITAFHLLQEEYIGAAQV